jgi:hypothetical protein
MATKSTKSRSKPETRTPPPTYTPTIHTQIAKAFMDALDQITPAISQPKPSYIHRLNYLRSYLNVPEAFLDTAVSAVADMPGLQAVQKLNVAEGRDTLQLIAAFHDVFNKIRAFEKSLKFVVDSRRASLAWDALQIYDVAKALARRTGDVYLTAWVENMKRDLGKRGRPKLTRARKVAAEAAAADMEEDLNPS